MEETILTLFGYNDNNVYTIEDVENDKSRGLYFYEQGECNACGKPDGKYYKTIIIHHAASHSSYCGGDCNKSIRDDTQSK